MAKYKSTGVIASGDYHQVKFEGTTKGGGKITINMPKALNMGNLDWTCAEKNDTVAQIVFTGVYSNTSAMSTSNDAPFTVEVASGVTAGASEILLGAGIVSIDGTEVALTRGGSQFVSTREFREINADGDRGAVEGRIVLDAERPTLTLNALTFLTSLTTMYPAMGTTT